MPRLDFRRRRRGSKHAEADAPTLSAIVFLMPAETHFLGAKCTQTLHLLPKLLKSRRKGPPSERTKRHKSLMRRMIRQDLFPHCYPRRTLVLVPRRVPFSPHVVLLPSEAVFWSSQFCLNDAPASENNDLLRREQGRSPA